MADNNGKWINPYRTAIQDTTTNLVFDSLSRYLDGWKEDSGRNPIVSTAGGNETRGNATVSSWYRIQGDWCTWFGSYTLGNTTAWPAGALNLVLPIPVDTTKFQFSASGQMGMGWVKAYNGAWYYGLVEIFTPTIAALQGPYTAPATRWTVNTVPFAFTTNHALTWNFSYLITPTVVQ